MIDTMGVLGGGGDGDGTPLLVVVAVALCRGVLLAVGTAEAVEVATGFDGVRDAVGVGTAVGDRDGDGWTVWRMPVIELDQTVEQARCPLRVFPGLATTPVAESGWQKEAPPASWNLPVSALIVPVRSKVNVGHVPCTSKVSAFCTTVA